MHNSTSKPKILKFIFFTAFAVLAFSASAQVKSTFTPRFSDGVNGDIAIIANNMVSQHETNAYTGEGDNNSITSVYVDIDSDGSTFNSSSANLVNPSPSSSCLTFRRAFLYWAAANKEHGDDGFGNYTGNGGTEVSWPSNQVKLMLPGSSSYTTLTADEEIYDGRAEHFVNDPYVNVKDITSQVQALSNPYGKFQVANVKATEGDLWEHRIGDDRNTGTSGGWQIVFIYESPQLKRRNITLFDGYANVTQDDNSFDVLFDGFQTVPNGPVNANIVIGSIEGDRGIWGDQLQIFDTDGNWTPISTNERDENNFFNSKITVNESQFLNRNPASTNTLGFDASLFELDNNGRKLIDNDQTSATIRMTSNQETYGLYLLGLSVEVFEPSLGALEFTTSIGGTTFNPGDTAPLQINVKNVGNDNIQNLEIATILPAQVDFIDTDPLPPGVTYNFNSGSRELRFFIQDGFTDINDPLYSLNFNFLINSSCPTCSTSVALQAVASFTGETNTNMVSALSSGTTDGCGTGNQDPTYLTIIPNVSIEPATATEGSPAAFNIASSHLMPNDAIFNVSYTNISTTGADYTSTTSVTFSANTSSTTLNVPTTDDNIIEPTETFEATISTTATVNIITEEETGTIIDNDAVTGTGVSFSNTDITVTEGTDAFAIFNVVLTGNISENVTVDYTTSDGTALNSSDYTTETGTIIFTPSQNSFNIQVPITDDAIIEPAEAFTLVLSNVQSNLGLGFADGNSTNTANGTINDNDAVTGTGISFDATDVTVNEDAGTATFTVRLTGNVAGGFTLDYATADGSAISPDDFTAQSGQLTFVGTDNEFYEIIVPIIDDLFIEATEGYTVNLSNLSTTLININTPQANGGINDNDGGVGTGIAFDATDVVVNEDAGTATFTVRLTGNVPGGFTLDYATADGSAISPDDFTAVSDQLTFVGTDNEFYEIIVPIIDDLFIEATEGYAVNLSNLSTTLIAINTPQANGGINDNDGGVGTGISFDATDVVVNEDAGTATFTVRLTGNVPGGFTLDYATANGSAISPDDFTAVSGQLTFVGTNNESYEIVVPIIDDLLIEATEGYTVNLSNLSTALIAINTPQANGGINDNDGGVGTGISFDATDVVVNEDAGTATFTVRLTGNVPGGFTLDYATANGSAISPDDFTAVSGQLTFVGTDNESYEIIVPIIDDILIEATEGYTVNLSNLSTTLIAINTPQANGGINDNDGGTGTGISFASTNVIVTEGTDLFARFNVILTGAITPGEDVTVDFVTNNGTAVDGADFTAQSGTLTLNSASTSQLIDILITDDALIEATENFNIVLSNIQSNVGIGFADGNTTNTANGTIMDNDGGVGTGIAFDATDVTVNEDAGTATFTVRLTGNVPGGFTLDYATADGSAISPDDFTAQSGQLTFVGTDNESYEIIVPIIDDLFIEATEGYAVNLSNLSTTLIAINTPQANGGINDNDGGVGTGIAFDATDVTVNEDAGTATFTVRLTGNVPGGFTLDYTTADGSAISPDDFTAQSGQLTFVGTDNESYEIIVPIIDDLLIEATEGYVVNLSNLSTTLIAINTPQANGGINDNDGGVGTGISFDATDVVVNEDAGTATFTVRLTGNVPGGFTLDYATADGSAISPDDFTAQSGQLTFVGTDNESYEIIVPIIDDLLIEATEGYTVNLSNLSTTVILINTPEANGGIIDNDMRMIISSDYTKEYMLTCGEEIPEVPELTFSGGCGDYQVDFTEVEESSDTSDDFMIIRTWNVTDLCGNTASFEQIIFVMQLEEALITIDICVEDDAIDLVTYLPENFDINGTFAVTQGVALLDGSFFDPADLELGEYIISYSSTVGACIYSAEFTINVNADCVECSEDDVIVSTAVTPNGDNINDFFEITGAENCFFTYDIMLFNRWGNKVAEAKDYQNNWGGESPDGSFGAQGMLPAGTYYYIINITNRLDLKPINGYIYLGTK